MHADEIWGLQDATIPDLGWIGTVGLGLRSAVIHIRACWSESTDFTFLYLPRNHHEPRVQLAFENCEAKKAIKKRKQKKSQVITAIILINTLYIMWVGRKRELPLWFTTDGGMWGFFAWVKERGS